MSTGGRLAEGAAVRYHPLHMANRWVALAIVFVTRTSMGYQFRSVASVGPLLVPELGLTWAQLGSLIGLYMLPGAFLALPGGMLGQRRGERRPVVASLALMVVGGLVTAASHSFAVAAAGRLLSGVGAVLMNILLAKMVADWFTEREMSTAMAVMLTSWPVGLGLAAATLGSLATRSSWRMAIAMTALAAAVGLVLIAFAYRDPPPAPARAPGPGVLPARPDGRGAAGSGDVAPAEVGGAGAAGARLRRLLRGVLRHDGGHAARRRARARPHGQPRPADPRRRARDGLDGAGAGALPPSRAGGSRGPCTPASLTGRDPPATVPYERHGLQSDASGVRRGSLSNIP